MAELKIKDLIDEEEIQKLKDLDASIQNVKNTYVAAARELAAGLKINVEGVADLEKLANLYATQSKNVGSASNELVEALKKQSEVTQSVTRRIEEKLNAEKLSSTEIKNLTKASSDNAASLEKAAKAEAALAKFRNESTGARKKAALAEEERLALIRAAIALTEQEVHSIQEANQANKTLRNAVKLLKDTDEGYAGTLGRLNATIGVNTDYVKRNSDRYTQQKMTVGAYREEIKAAWIELNRGNVSMKNFGIVAKGFGGILRSSVSSGFNQVSIGIGNMIKGMVGAQAIIIAFQKLLNLVKSGIQSIVDFEAANSKLAAILGTTSRNIKDLTIDAQKLGATTKYTASEVTKLQIELAKLGFSRKEILQSTEGILKFAQATGSELPDAAALAGAALRMFNADISETERYVSAMAIATTKSALSFSYLQTAMPIVGPVAKAFNFTIEDTLALLGKLADAGFDASSAATATRNILLNLADSSGKLAKALGNPVKTLPELVAGLQKLKAENVDLATTLELTDKRSVSQFNTFLRAADNIMSLREQVTGVTEELNGMATEMANNVEGAVAGLSSAWEALMLSFSGGTGAAKDFIDWVAAKIRQIADLLKDPEQHTSEAAAKLELAAQKEVQTKMELQELEYQKRVKQLREQYNKKYLDEGLEEGVANAKALKEAQIQAAKEALVSLKDIKSQQKEVSAQDLRNLENAERLYTQALKDWGEKSKFLGINFKNAFPKMYRYETDEIKNANKAFLEFANIKMDISKTKAYNKSLGELIEKMETIVNPPKENSNSKKILTDKEKRELEKAAKEKQKIEEAYQESKLALMDEGLEKELAKIGLAYSKKMATVKGNSDEEIKTRQNLAKEMQDKIDEFTVKYNFDRERKNVENALAVVRKGSQEELELKLRQLELQREAEIDAAEKTGEDIFIIDEKYAGKKQEIYEKYASSQLQLIVENAAHEQQVRDGEYATEILALKKQLEAKQITQQKYNEEEYRISLEYARKTGEAAIETLEMDLKVENLSAKDRARITEQLQTLKAKLAQEEAEAEIDAIRRINEEEEKSRKKRMENLEKWLQTASRAIGEIGELVSTVYDAQIGKIEEEQNINEEAHEREIERTEVLEEQGVITKEEAEARKRAAEDRTQAKNEELERKKQQLAYKQALWEKNTSVSQAGIATALAIAKALPDIVLAAIVGAMGALQVATILATPIPAYAEGTKGKDGHPGGFALVGDGGKQEVVAYSGKAWITPRVPTLVDLPVGARVFPDVDTIEFPRWDASILHPINTSDYSFSAIHNKETIIINDYRDLRAEIKGVRQELKNMARQQHRDAYNMEYEQYKRTRL